MLHNVIPFFNFLNSVFWNELGLDVMTHMRLCVSVCVCTEGLFQVQYNGNPSVRLSPCTGVIAAGATQWLKVELRTDGPRMIDEKAL